MKTLDALTVKRHGVEILIEAVARSFLHNQVRIITGTLKLVGEGNGRRPMSPLRLPLETAPAPARPLPHMGSVSSPSATDLISA